MLWGPVPFSSTRDSSTSTTCPATSGIPAGSDEVSGPCRTTAPSRHVHSIWALGAALSKASHLLACCSTAFECARSYSQVAMYTLRVR